MKKIVLSIFGAGIVIIMGLLIAYGIVSWNASGRTYDDVSDIPHNKVGLLLGTSPFTRGGAHNYYYDNRINSAEDYIKLVRLIISLPVGEIIEKNMGINMMSHSQSKIP